MSAPELVRLRLFMGMFLDHLIESFTAPGLLLFILPLDLGAHTFEEVWNSRIYR
jgi:hypothetical protein